MAPERSKKNATAGRKLYGAAAAAVLRKAQGEPSRTKVPEEAPAQDARSRKKPSKTASTVRQPRHEGTPADSAQTAEPGPSVQVSQGTATSTASGTTDNSRAVQSASPAVPLAPNAAPAMFVLTDADVDRIVSAMTRASAAVGSQAAASERQPTVKNVKIPKPKGSIGGGKNGYHIQESMGLIDDRPTYNELKDTVHKVAIEAGVNLQSTWAQLSAEKLAQVYATVRMRQPRMADYENDWATAALLQQYLRNSRKQPKIRRTAKVKGKGRARREPITLDDAMDAIDDDEHPHTDGEADSDGSGSEGDA